MINQCHLVSTLLLHCVRKKNDALQFWLLLRNFKILSKVLRKIKYEAENFVGEFSEKQLQVCPLWNYLFEEDWSVRSCFVEKFIFSVAYVNMLMKLMLSNITVKQCASSCWFVSLFMCAKFQVKLTSLYGTVAVFIGASFISSHSLMLFIS